MRAGPAAVLIVAALALAACTETTDGLLPVGGASVDEVTLARFVRRLHLDLAGAPPDEATVTAEVATLEAGGAGRAVRERLVDARLADPAFASTWADELENRAFAGIDPVARTAQACADVRAGDAACAEACGPLGRGEDPCGCTGCATLAALAADRDALAAARRDLAAGATTGAIDRRYAASVAYRLDRASPVEVVTALFEDFLGRAPEPEERDQAVRIALGGLSPTTGLLFHRHGGSYEDLIAIVFESEPYREAAVDAVFQRYLGRAASGAELAHFAAGLVADAAAPDAPSPDAPSPDVRPVLRAVLASSEYFDP